MKYSFALILLVVLLLALAASVIYNVSTQGPFAFETLFSAGMTLAMAGLVWFLRSRTPDTNQRQ